jgi:hypothetical protein
MGKKSGLKKLCFFMVLSMLMGLMPINVLFGESGVKYSHRDDFNSFDSSFWTVVDRDGAAMDKVSVSDGKIKLSATETDNYPTLISKGIPIAMGDKLIIKRRTYAHAEHDKFAPSAYVTEEVDDSWNLDRNRANHILLFFQHLYFTYEVGRYPEDLTKGNFGYARLDSFTKPSALAKENYGITRITLDEWVDEEFIYDTVTGDVSITSGGETMNFKGRPLEYSHVRFHMSPYGWYTGQYDQMDWIEFKVVGPNAEDLIEDNSNPQDVIEDNTNADVVSPGGSGLVYSVREDFSSSTLNSDFWYVYDKGGRAYDRVSLANGELTLPCDVTDDPPILMSKGIPIQKGDIFKVRRRTFAHASNDTYRPWTVVQEVNTDAYTTDKNASTSLYSFQHLNFTFEKGRYPNAVTQNNLGLYISPGQDLKTLPESQFGVSPLTLDKWVEEEMIYNTATGQVTIVSDGNTMEFMSKPLEKSYVRYLMNPYGWGTGHYDKLDWVEFTIERPGASTNSGQGLLQGTVLEQGSDRPLSGVSVSLVQGGRVVSTTTTNASGEYSFSTAPGQYDLKLTKSGYIEASYYGLQSVANETTFVEAIIQVPQSAGSGSLSGQVLNAVTGGAEPGVTIEIRKGLNNQAGPIEATIQADSNGMYTYKGLAGYYTLTAKKSGFSNKTFSESIDGGSERRASDVAISPHLDSNQIRVVLRWSDNPKDLDAQIFGPTYQGNKIRVYFENPRVTSGNSSLVLDVDDKDGGGPETITLTNPLEGTYTYYVTDYTNRASKSSTALANSKATVEVYVGNAPAKIFNVPNLEGGIWKVFTIEGTTIKPVNMMGYDVNNLKSAD